MSAGYQFQIVDDAGDVLFDFHDPTGANNPAGVKSRLRESPNFGHSTGSPTYSEPDNRPGGTRLTTRDELVEMSFSVKLWTDPAPGASAALEVAMSRLQSLLRRGGELRFRGEPSNELNIYDFVHGYCTHLLNAQPDVGYDVYDRKRVRELGVFITRQPHHRHHEPITSATNKAPAGLLALDFNEDGIADGWTFDGWTNLSDCRIDKQTESQLFALNAVGERILRPASTATLAAAAPGDVWTFAGEGAVEDLGRLKGRIEFLDGSFAPVGGGTFDTAEWQTPAELPVAPGANVVVTSGAAPAGTAFVRGSIVASNSGAGDGTYRVRRAQLEKAAAPSPFVVGDQAVSNALEPLTRVAYDDWGRAVSNGFGSAPSGQVWEVDNGPASDASVVATTFARGQIANPSSGVDHRVSLAVSVKDVKLFMPIRADSTPSPGEFLEHGFIARRTAATTFYRAVVRINNARSVFVRVEKMVAGVTTVIYPETDTGIVLPVAAQDRVQTEFLVAGPWLRMRVWMQSSVTGAPAPARWTAEVFDTSITAAGRVGVHSMLIGTTPVTSMFTKPLGVFDVSNDTGKQFRAFPIFVAGDAEGPVRIEFEGSTTDIARTALAIAHNDGVAGNNEVVDLADRHRYAWHGVPPANTASIAAETWPTVTMTFTDSKAHGMFMTSRRDSGAVTRRMGTWRFPARPGFHDIWLRFYTGNGTFQLRWGLGTGAPAFAEIPVEYASVRHDQQNDQPRMVRLGRIEVPPGLPTDVVTVEVWSTFYTGSLLNIDAIEMRSVDGFFGGLESYEQVLESVAGIELTDISGSPSPLGDTKVLDAAGETVGGPLGFRGSGPIRWEFTGQISRLTGSGGVNGALQIHDGTAVVASRSFSYIGTGPGSTGSEPLNIVLGIDASAAVQYQARVTVSSIGGSTTGEIVVERLKLVRQPVAKTMVSDPDAGSALYLEASGSAATVLRPFAGPQPLRLPPGLAIIRPTFEHRPPKTSGEYAHALDREVTVRHSYSERRH